MQNDLELLSNWSEKWLLGFNIPNTKHMRIGKEDAEGMKYYLRGEELQRVRHEKDIGVTIESDLSFDIHLSEKANKATSMFALIRRSFEFLDTEMFTPLYKALVRSHPDFASSVWAPYKIKHIDQIENVQRRATKQIPGPKKLSYPERLRALKLPTMSYRRLRDDLIEVYKMLNGEYDNETCRFLKLWKDMAPRSSTRGHGKKLFPQH